MLNQKHCFIFATENGNDVVFRFGKVIETEIKNKIKKKKYGYDTNFDRGTAQALFEDAKLYKEYLVLTAVPESSRTAIMQILMKKYEIASTSTYYDIINRMKGGTK